MARKQSGQRFYFSPQLILQLTEDPEGANIFQGGWGVVQMLISIETHLIVIFQGGRWGLDPLSPLWISTCIDKKCL